MGAPRAGRRRARAHWARRVAGSSPPGGCRAGGPVPRSPCAEIFLSPEATLPPAGFASALASQAVRDPLPTHPWRPDPPTRPGTVAGREEALSAKGRRRTHETAPSEPGAPGRGALREGPLYPETRAAQGHSGGGPVGPSRAPSSGRTEGSHPRPASSAPRSPSPARPRPVSALPPLPQPGCGAASLREKASGAFSPSHLCCGKRRTRPRRVRAPPLLRR